MVKPAITILTIDISLMRILRDGPEVSLNGLPTVSPTFAKAQRQIYKLISQMPQISAAQMSENMGIANPQVLSVEHFSIADCKSARTPDGIYQLACL